MGSTIQRARALRLPWIPNSSPTRAWSGRAAARRSAAAFSTARSAWVTGVISGFVSTTRSTERKCRSVIASAASAISMARSRSGFIPWIVAKLAASLDQRFAYSRAMAQTTGGRGSAAGSSVRWPRGMAVVATAFALSAGTLGVLAASTTPSSSAGPLQWSQWQHLVGVFDVGLQPDGAGLVAEGSELFFDIDRSGNMIPINTPTAFHDARGEEAYFAVSAGEPTGGGCRFGHGAIYVLDPRSPKQALEIDQNSGQPRRFATIPGGDSLNGIAFDGSGAFGDHPLLVTGPSGTHSVIAAIGCHGDVTTISGSAPRMEGGVTVAPKTFGGHASELIAVDEIGGDIIGVTPAGTISTLVNLPQPKGGDLGVESTGFVPADFLTHGGAAYPAHRGTANNPHPGTDSLLRLTSSQLAPAGLHEGDLLVATEGAAATLALTRAPPCSLLQLP